MMSTPLQWRPSERDGVSNHRRFDCLLNRLFRRRWKKIKAPRHWPLWGEFPAQRPSNAEKREINGSLFFLRWSLIPCTNSAFRNDWKCGHSVYSTWFAKSINAVLSKINFVFYLYHTSVHWAPGYALLRLTEAAWRIYAYEKWKPTLAQMMACRLFGSKPLSEPMLTCCQLNH